MKTKTGVWIDQSRALIVVLNGAHEKVRVIESRVASQPRRGSDTPSGARFDAHHITADATRHRTHASELREFYSRVLAAIPGAGELVLLGPGHAKAELRKHMQAEGWAGRVVGVEPADKMSDRQFAAFVRASFRPPNAPAVPAYRPWYTSASASRIPSSSFR